MKKCMDCNSNVSSATVRYMDRMALINKVERGTYYCLNCQVRHGLNTFDNMYTPKLSPKKNSIHVSELFNLEPGESFVKGKEVVDGSKIHGHMTYSYLRVLDSEGLLPKGYLTRVTNGHISIEASYKMCGRAYEKSAYRIASASYEGKELIALIKKAV